MAVGLWVGAVALGATSEPEEVMDSRSEQFKLAYASC